MRLRTYTLDEGGYLLLIDRVGTLEPESLDKLIESVSHFKTAPGCHGILCCSGEIETDDIAGAAASGQPGCLCGCCF